eukprot:1368644-Amorphochlora_amoeboformis.AAC.1
MRSKRRRMAAGGRNGAWVRRGGHRGIASRLTSRQMSQRVTTKPGVRARVRFQLGLAVEEGWGGSYVWLRR